MAATTITAPNLENFFVTEENRIAPQLLQRNMHKSIWNLGKIKKVAFPQGMGDVIRRLTYERSLPANNPTWTNVLHNDGTGNNCPPQAQLVEFAQTLREWGLQQTALESPDICVNDTRTTFEIASQMKAIYTVLEENSAYVWENRSRDEYIRIAQHKMVAAAGLPEDTAAFPAIVPTSGLTQGILDRIYGFKSREAHMRGALGQDRGSPVYGLITDQETSDSIIQQNTKILSDFRESSRVDELLQAMGINRSYRGYFHMVDNFLPRYNFVDGAFVRVQPYDPLVATTKGNMADLSLDYLNADFTASIVFNSEVYHCSVPNVITSAGNAKFEPQNYWGEWKWKNIPDREKNPDGNYGYFRGVYMTGSEPVFPMYGWVIMHKRCESPLFGIDCDQNDLYAA